MKKIFLLAVLVAHTVVAFAQVVYPSSILLYRQSQIDSFNILYGTPDVLEGGLYVGPGDEVTTDIYDLSPLNTIDVINGSILIEKTQHLKSLEGLNSLDSLYTNLYIGFNDSLENIAALSELEYLGAYEVRFRNNPQLQSLHGLEAISQISLGGNYLELSNNGFENCQGLNKLKRVTYLQVSGGALKNFIGLDSLTTIEGHLGLNNCLNLQSFDGLENLQLYGRDVYINNCPQLQNILGMGNSQPIPPLISVEIKHCPALTSLSGLNITADSIARINIQNTGVSNLAPFANLRKAWGGIYVQDNPHLTDLAITHLKDAGLNIINNDSLTNVGCLISLDTMPRSIDITDNDHLADINGLANVRQIGAVYISLNPALASLAPLSNLKRLVGHPNYYTLVLYHNTGLHSLAGLENLEDVLGQIQIEEPEVSDASSLFSGLQKATSIELRLPKVRHTLDICNELEDCGFISIGCGADTISGFSTLDSLAYHYFSGPEDTIGHVRGALAIGGNDSLKHITGFKNLKKITQNLDIVGNIELPHLDCFDSLKQVGHSGTWQGVIIQYNDKLQSINGLRNLTTLNDSMLILNNPQLTDCDALCALKSHIPHFSWKLRVAGSPFPCDTEQHIFIYCDTFTSAHELLPEEVIFTAQPNPTTDIVKVQVSDNHAFPLHIAVMNMQGNELYHTNANFSGEYTVHFGDFPTGIYYLVLSDNKGRRKVKKIVKLQ